MPQDALLDQYDKKILMELEKDAKKPFSTIASELDISHTMVGQRVTRLKALNIIKGSTIILDESKVGFDWAAFSGVVLQEDSKTEDVIKQLKAIPEVLECYFVSGEYALLIRIVAKDREDMRKLLFEKIDTIPGVVKSESMIDLGCAFKRNVPLSSFE